MMGDDHLPPHEGPPREGHPREGSPDNQGPDSVWPDGADIPLEVRQLTALVCQGLATQEDLCALEQWLRNDPSAQDYYFRVCEIHASLYLDFRFDQTDPAQNPEVDPSATQPESGQAWDFDPNHDCEESVTEAAPAFSFAALALDEESLHAETIIAGASETQVDLRSQLRESQPQASQLPQASHAPESSGAETSGAETPGAETPGAETPGAETSGADATSSDDPAPENRSQENWSSELLMLLPSAAEQALPELPEDLSFPEFPTPDSPSLDVPPLNALPADARPSGPLAPESWKVECWKVECWGPGPVPEGIPAAEDPLALTEQVATRDRVEVGSAVLPSSRPGRGLRTGRRRRGRGFLARFALAAVAVGAFCLSCILLLAVFFVHRLDARLEVRNDPHRLSRSSLRSVATLVGTRATTWSPGDALHVGDRLVESQVLRLLQGQATLQFDRGALLRLVGPAELIVSDGNRVHVRRGRVSVTVSRRAIGFEVSTPSTRVTDLGTSFQLAVDDRGTSRLQVTQGQVECRQVDRSGTPVNRPWILKPGQVFEAEPIGF